MNEEEYIECGGMAWHGKACVPFAHLAYVFHLVSESAKYIDSGSITNIHRKKPVVKEIYY